MSDIRNQNSISNSSSNNNSNNNDDVQRVTTTDEFKISLGERIGSDDGYIGTIRYEGKVDGFEGNWFGIEWDHPTRGKHRGTVKGKQYFQCQYPDSSGSFMKKEKIIKGVDLIHALITKFTRKLENYDDLTVHSTKSNKMIQIEMVGMDQLRERQKNLKSHSSINAYNLSINKINTNILNQCLSNLIELNLSHNYLNNWNEIIDLIIQLPLLNKLILSENRLVFNHVEIDNQIKGKGKEIQESNLTSLTLFDMGGSVTWDHVCYLTENIFKNIQVLAFGKNKLHSIQMNSSSSPSFKHLKSLDLAYNNITCLNDVKALGDLLSLEELNLNHNQITSLQLDNQCTNDSDEKYKIFCNLKRIYLSNNLINDWSEIDVLDRFKSLVELSFRDNPVLDSLILSSTTTTTTTTSTTTTTTATKTIEEEENSFNEEFNVNSISTKSTNYKDIVSLKRLHIIPRISQLLKLNLTEITSTERRDAERFFLYEYYSNNNNNKTISKTKLTYLTSIHGER
ncbi:hypothetical protein CYY_009660 [Polysphondylium violaceum]|uniref:CAP-Gly domain-containing protein n=1 Tax=Polysphondylium violaceum TaxID=133409 RepID=A0A8J4PLE6_9MYCE|nr:hypothetical protein CYY_009660 [Polysphondylium violaceum]